MGTTNDCLNDNGIEKCQFNAHARVKHKVLSFLQFWPKRPFLRIRMVRFLRTFTYGFFDHKKKYKTAPKSTQYRVNKIFGPNCHFKTLPQTLLIRFSCLDGTVSFFGRFNKKRCQNAQEIILHQISWYPKKFKTWSFFFLPLYNRPLLLMQVKAIILIILETNCAF